MGRESGPGVRGKRGRVGMGSWNRGAGFPEVPALCSDFEAPLGLAEAVEGLGGVIRLPPVFFFSRSQTLRTVRFL